MTGYIRILTDMEEDLSAWGSDGLFETVIENVVKNAIGYSPSGGEYTYFPAA